MTDLILESRRIITPEGARAGRIFIRGGRIERVVKPGADLPAARVLDVGDLVVMPGIIDAQVSCHVPGLSAAEGFRVSTRAAAAGGVSAVVEVAFSAAPGATSGAALRARREAARGNCHVDVGFWGGVVDEHIEEIDALKAAGALGFQCYLSDDGPAAIEAAGALNSRALEALLPALKALGAPLICHPELGDAIARAERVWACGDAAHYGLYLASRPPGAVSQVVARLSELAERLDVPVHFAQISAGRALPFFRRARARGVNLSAGTCAHYLFFSSDSIKNGQTIYAAAPPIRSRGNRDKLWKALAAGELNFVSSGHMERSAHEKALDTGRFDQAAPGFSSLQLLLPVMWSAARARGYGVEALAEWLCRAPAELVGLGATRGQIAPGYRADLVVWDPDASFEVDAEALEHHHKLGPYQGRELAGRVRLTFVGGAQVYSRPAEAEIGAGEFAEPAGQLIDPA